MTRELSVDRRGDSKPSFDPNKGPDSSDTGPIGRLRRVTESRITVALLLALYALMSFTSALSKSPTGDEPAYLAGGYSHLVTGDYRLHPENGQLPQRWAALPLLLGNYEFSMSDTEGWRKSNHFRMGTEFLFESGNDHTRILAWGRAMMVFIGMALGLVVYLWARTLLGPTAGSLALLFYTFEPSLLGNGRIVQADLTATLFLVLAITFLWWLLHRMTFSTLIVGGLALGVLALSKVSGVLVVPMLGAMVIVRLSNKDPLILKWGSKARQFRGQFSKLGTWAVGLLIQFAMVVALVWAAYGFRYAPFSEKALLDDTAPMPQLMATWPEVLKKGGMVRNTLSFAREHRLLPEAYVFGYAYIYHYMERKAFMRGKYSVTGWWYFFPYCLLIKTPLGLLLCLCLGAGALLRRRNEEASGERDAKPFWYRSTPLWVLLVVYGVASLLTTLNIGHRHLLPIYPTLIVLASASVFWLVSSHRLLKWLTVAGVLWMIGASLWVRPHYISYFNELVGGSSKGYRHLVDSSLDIGQDLPALRKWLEENQLADPTSRAERVHLAYFGCGLPSAYGVHVDLLPCRPDLRKERSIRPLEPGIYCISATMFQTVTNRAAFGHWCPAREREYQGTLKLVQTYRDLRGKPEERRKFMNTLSTKKWREIVTQYELLRLGRLCKYLLHRRPDAYAAYSILIFRVSRKDLDEALFGEPVEMHPTPGVKGL